MLIISAMQHAVAINKAHDSSKLLDSPWIHIYNSILEVGTGHDTVCCLVWSGPQCMLVHCILYYIAASPKGGSMEP